ncbi:hypothetical protein F5Y05DRAFT_205858 [Hypoxylon sp. FL0543]|nr:hypothetical protein F5Y05DRAFT_205858 [Hypoxylon sp. FL0543]
MRVSAIFVAGFAALALAAPIEAPAELAERQYRPTYKQIEEADTEKRQDRPPSKQIEEADTEKRQYEPIEKQIKEIDVE